MKSFIAIITALIVLSFSAMGQETKSQNHQMDSTKAVKPTIAQASSGYDNDRKKIATIYMSMHPEVIANNRVNVPNAV